MKRILSRGLQTRYLPFALITGCQSYCKQNILLLLHVKSVQLVKLCIFSVKQPLEMRCVCHKREHGPRSFIESASAKQKPLAVKS